MNTILLVVGFVAIVVVNVGAVYGFALLVQAVAKQLRRV
jgi:hypothetical protein